MEYPTRSSCPQINGCTPNGDNGGQKGLCTSLDRVTVIVLNASYRRLEYHVSCTKIRCFEAIYRTYVFSIFEEPVFCASFFACVPSYVCPICFFLGEGGATSKSQDIISTGL